MTIVRYGITQWLYDRLSWVTPNLSVEPYLAITFQLYGKGLWAIGLNGSIIKACLADSLFHILPASFDKIR